MRNHVRLFCVRCSQQLTGKGFKTLIVFYIMKFSLKGLHLFPDLLDPSSGASAQKLSRDLEGIYFPWLDFRAWMQRRSERQLVPPI